MQFNLSSFLLGMAVVALIGLFGARNLQEKIRRFETQVAHADSINAVVVAENAALGAAILDQQEQNVLLGASNAALERQLQTASRTIKVLQGTLAGLDSAVQADSACWRLCQPSIAARDTIIRLTAAQRDSAFLGLQRTDTALTRTADLLARSQDQLARQDSVIAAYKRATDLAPTHQTIWAKLKPEVGIGGWAGYDLRWQDWGYGIAFTFDWSLF